MSGMSGGQPEAGDIGCNLIFNKISDKLFA